MKKKLILFTFIITAVLSCLDKVTAANINWSGITYECVYSDGSLFEYSYNDYSKSYVTNKYPYNLKGTDPVLNGSSSTIIYAEHTKPIYLHTERRGSNDTYYCQKYMIKSVVSSDGGEEEDGEGQTTTYIKFDNDSKYEQFTDSDFGETWKDHFWFWQTATAEIANENRKGYYLVSENYILTEKAGQPDEVYSYKRADELGAGQVTQAIAKPKFITILKYGNKYFAQSEYKTSLISNPNKAGVMYFSDGDPHVNTGSDGAVFYSYNNIRISAIFESTYKSISDKSNYERYVYAGLGNANQNANSGSLCTKIMPNTAKVLAKIIGYVQLIVPVLLIVLTGIDIGRIIVSGNLDEELPKQKKKILVRLITAIAIFFLPLIVQLLLTTVKIDSGSTEDEIGAIEYIKCIFDMI